jgi:hypothetical protein
MSLEEREGTETPGAVCEECGTPLTAAELELALESGGPALCTVHATESAALPDDDAPAG